MSQNPKIKKHIQSLKALSDSMDDYLFVWDIHHGNILFFGDIDKEFDLRVDGEEEITEQQFMNVVHPRDKEALGKDFNAIKRGEKQSHDLNYRWISRSGKPIWVNCRGNVITDGEGDQVALIGRVSKSIFDNKVNEITGMFNRRKLLEDSRKQQYMAKDGFLMFFSPDRLSTSYSEYGRIYMENLLANCARTLEEIACDRCKIYHVEEGVFAVCFLEMDRKEVQCFYNEAIKQMQEYCTVTAVALPSSRQYFTDERELYAAATAELVKAKKTRRAKLTFYSKKSINEQLNERLLEEKIERAVNNDFEGFYLCYQPQIRGGEYTIDGVEALMRFRADGVEYPPSQFIPIMEQTGLIHEAGIWVLKKAIEQVKIWREKLPELYLNVNFSLIQFADPDIIEKVIKIYKESGLPPHVLTLELTETVEMEDLDRIASATKTWKTAGIDVALDDFGTGYSNLAMLKEISCSEIKIERRFISRVKKGSYGYLLTSSIINFAHQNDIAVCCEGVETIEDVTTLSPLKPDLYQGYAFDKPLKVAEFEKNYIEVKSAARLQRCKLANRLVKMDEARITKFDSNELLSNIGVGLCLMHWDVKTRTYEWHPDEVTISLLGMKPNLTPIQYNDFWFKRIKSGYEHYVRKNLRRLSQGAEVSQFMYPWIHPEKGEIILSFSGTRAESKNGKVVVKGLYRIVTGIEETNFGEARPLKYFVENRYMDMILNKAIAFMEINVTRNKVQGGMRDMQGNQPRDQGEIPDLYDADGDLSYNEYEKWWADKYLLKCDKDFYKISHCDYLRECYERGETSIELLCKCEDKDGKVYDCKKSICITRDEFIGDVMALCVIYDVSEETKQRMEFMHRDATIRSLADDYKSIMYLNLDEDTVEFYREDTTLEQWKKEMDKHSVLMNIFAERFVHEEDLAEYKYLQSTSTIREKLLEVEEYRFEYKRKCRDGVYRYHEVTIKRDDLNEEAFCAIIGVKEIEEEVQMRLQLEEALALAYTDHLTGLYNQQGLLNRCKEVLKDKSINAAVLFMDLDNFKTINDVYGHGMGDKVLHEVGKVLREETRGKDVVGRYGGDEFVVLIYDIRRVEDAEEVPERISSRINRICQKLKLRVDMTASIGLSFTGQTGYDYHHLKEIADDRLYLAKKRGKNQIVKN